MNEVFEALKLHQDTETGRWICDIADYVSSGATPREAVTKTILMVRITIATEKAFRTLVQRAAQKLPLPQDEIIEAFRGISIPAAFELAASKEYSVFDRDYWPEDVADGAPCPKCTAGRIGETEYCDCPMGRDLRKVEARKETEKVTDANV